MTAQERHFSRAPLFQTLSMKQLVLALAATVALAPAASARVRAVHRPSPHQCAFSLAPAWNGNIPAAGVTRAAVLVFGQSQACAGWAAYSSDTWALVEAAPLDAQPAAYVTIGANDQTTPRTTTLIVAGVRLQVTQEGASGVISPPRSMGLIVNGTFDKDVSGWGWFARYPNGPGLPQWSQIDANGSPASGSMLLRDADQSFTQSFQQLQCVRITGKRRYEFGVKVRTGGDQGEALVAFLTYASNDCSGNYVIRNVQTARPEPGVWQALDYSQNVGAAGSAILLLGSAADVPPFDVWFDDAYVREK